MKKPQYIEQLYAFIFLMLGCTFVLFGVIWCTGIFKSLTNAGMRTRTTVGMIFSALGIAFFIAQAISLFLAAKKKKRYSELLTKGMKVQGMVEKVYRQRFTDYGRESPYRILYQYTYKGKVYHHRSHLLWGEPHVQATDSIEVFVNDAEQSAVL